MESRRRAGNGVRKTLAMSAVLIGDCEKREKDCKVGDACASI